jgi:MoaA/NifB/PqqE/SkfB family radical SAM enzyme
MSKTFCVMPWMNISVDPDGSIKPCCISHQYIHKENGEKYNLGHDKLETIINSPEYVELRQKMIVGESIEGCKQCYAIEQYGKSESKRNIFNRTWLPKQEIRKKVSQGPVIDNTVYDFDLRFGNLCNLSCRSCIPVNSSQLEKELHELEADTTISKFFTINSYPNINEWYETETFEYNIKSNLESIQQLYITGGEPTIIKKNQELLRFLVDTGKSKNIRLILNSNMTNINPAFYELLPEFESVLFFASVDGYKEIQEYLRYPSNWSQVDKNVNKLISLKGNITIKFCPTIQIGNINKLVDLFEYVENLNKAAGKAVAYIWLNLLEFPSHLNIVHLPVEYKKICWDRIQHWVDTKCEYQDATFHERLAALKNKCLTETSSTEEMSKFFEMNDIFDNHRSHYIKDINPELNSLRV